MGHWVVVMITIVLLGMKLVVCFVLMSVSKILGMILGFGVLRGSLISTRVMIRLVVVTLEVRFWGKVIRSG